MIPSGAPGRGWLHGNSWMRPQEETVPSSGPFRKSEVKKQNINFVYVRVNLSLFPIPAQRTEAKLSELSPLPHPSFRIASFSYHFLPFKPTLSLQLAKPLQWAADGKKSTDFPGSSSIKGYV